jgi:hypothetical protein
VGEAINRDEPMKLAESEKTVYIETSAKTGENVEKAFIELAQQMKKHDY